MCFQNVAPRLINENRGVILTGIIGILLMSWELLKKLGWLETDVSVESLYSNWLLGYSSLLGPIAGIMIVDYFLIKKQSYDVMALYKDDAGYPAWNISRICCIPDSGCAYRSRAQITAVVLVLHLRLVYRIYFRRTDLLHRRQESLRS